MAKKYPTLTVYFGPEKAPLLTRLRALSTQYKISDASILVACLEACLDTLEKEIPKRRSFQLNGQQIIV